MSIFTGKELVFKCELKSVEDCEANYNANLDKLEVKLRPTITVDKDTKFMFHSSNKAVPRGYDNCAFFCWIHTYFVSDSMRESMKREHLDNPHKEKTWGVWRKSFSLEIVFENGEYVSEL